MVGLTGLGLSSSQRDGPRLLRLLQVAARLGSRSTRLHACPHAAVPRFHLGTLPLKPTRSVRAGTGLSGVDLAIRYGRGNYPGLTSTRMIADRFAPVVNPKLGVHAPKDLARVPLIYFECHRSDPDDPTWATYFRAAGIPEIEPVSVLRFTKESHAIQAAVAGQGVALLSLTLVRDELDRGQLSQPFGPTVNGLTFYLVEAEGRTRPAPVEAARGWLMGEISSIA